MAPSSAQGGAARWFVAGDLDGFLGLGLDNLIQILLILSLCRGVLGYPDPLLIGNLAYAQQAQRLSRLEGRNDRTALPYGINTMTVFAFVFLVMLLVLASAALWVRRQREMNS